MRYAAPADVGGISLACGSLTVSDGFVEVPEDAGEGDLGALRIYGFTPAPAEAAKPVKTTKADEPDTANP